MSAQLAAQADAVLNPATFTVAGLSVYIQRSIPSIHRDLAAGRLVRPVRIGKALRFIKADIDKWLSMGCPSRDEFEARAKTAR